MPVKEGDKIKVHYTGSLEDGTVFDSSEGKEPIEFEAGKGMVIKGFDSAVIGMEKGDEKEVTIKPDEAYGTSNDQLFQKVPKDQFPKDQEIKPGMMMLLKAPDGRQIPAKVASIDGEEVTIDLNHPLAGKTLKFKIKVEEIA